AVLLAAPKKARGSVLSCIGLGFGREKGTIQTEAETPRGAGLVEAVRAPLQDAALKPPDIDYRIADLNGEQYGFKEASLALTRCLLERKPVFDLWHPADCVGEIGAAFVPCALGVALEAARKGYAPGRRALCHFGNDSGERAALVLDYSGGK